MIHLKLKYQFVDTYKITIHCDKIKSVVFFQVHITDKGTLLVCEGDVFIMYLLCSNST